MLVKFGKNIFYFFLGCFLHIVLLHLFALSFYAIYFVCLLIASYILQRYYAYFSYKIFLPLVFLALVLVSSNLYDNYLFELYLYLDAVDKNLYINREVMYGLLGLHLILLFNLKKFESFWVIMDKKVFRT